MSEAELMDLIVQAADLGGWLVYHTYDSRRSRPGFPDLVMVRRGEMLFVELKSQKGRLRPDQKVWLAAIDEVHTISAGVIRPSEADALIERLTR